MGCGGGEDGDMVLMIDSVVMWMMMEGGVARLVWPEISPDNGREEWEALDCVRERGIYAMLQFDLTKPLPLKGRPGHLSIAAEYFFNNDLEFLKSFDREKKYTTSITKTKVARYEIVGIEDMTPMLWSTIKHGYDKDAKKGIKH
ncbi:hypothetical protein Tco_1095532 [Tanacetum coccineum]